MRASPDNIDMIIFHAQCPDGSAAAWSALQRHPNAEAIPANYENGPPDVRGRNVAIVDFSYGRAETEQIIRDAASVIILDHHATAEENLQGLPEADFDMLHSGAMLSWRWFHPKKDPPWVIRYVEDRDLWRWALPNSRAVGSFFQQFAPFTPESIEEINRLSLDEAMAQGLILRRTMEAYCTATRHYSTSMLFEGHKIRVANSTRWGVSELANSLIDEEHAIGMVWFHDHKDNIVRVSLRSSSTVNVRHLAQKHGGGGHPDAAGFEVGSPADLFRLLEEVPTGQPEVAGE